MSRLCIQPVRSLDGTLTLPGDKSISHRALLVAGVSRGTSRIRHLLKSGDVERSRRAMEDLGIAIHQEGESVLVEGRPDGGLQPPRGPLEMGNSGTTTRLLLGLLAGHPIQATLVGDASLSKRPMRRVTEPLEKMGAVFSGAGGMDHLPLTIRGGPLSGIRHICAVPSAQVKSALLLAGLYAQGPTCVVESIGTRDHTERILTFFGAQLQRNGLETTVVPGKPLEARTLTIPGDISSGAFFLVAALLVPGSSVTVQGVGLNPTRTGFLEVLKRMGANLVVARSPQGATKQSDDQAWEPTGDVTAHSSPLRCVTIEPSLIPALIDELPILMVAATQAQGLTVIEGAGELRVKETDRIQSMVEGLTAMGAAIRSQGEEIVIEGPTGLRGASVRSFEDHRTAMSLAVAGLVAQGPTTVEGAQWIDISFPGFAEHLSRIQR